MTHAKSSALGDDTVHQPFHRGRNIFTSARTLRNGRFSVRTPILAQSTFDHPVLPAIWGQPELLLSVLRRGVGYLDDRGGGKGGLGGDCNQYVLLDSSGDDRLKSEVPSP